MNTIMIVDYCYEYVFKLFNMFKNRNLKHVRCQNCFDDYYVTNEEYTKQTDQHIPFYCTVQCGIASLNK